MINFNKNKKGFTLIELVIVVAIIAILSAVLLPNLVSFVQSEKRREAISNVKSVYTAANQVYAEMKSLGLNYDTVEFNNKVADRAGNGILPADITITFNSVGNNGATEQLPAGIAAAKWTNGKSGGRYWAEYTANSGKVKTNADK